MNDGVPFVDPAEAIETFDDPVPAIEKWVRTNLAGGRSVAESASMSRSVSSAIDQCVSMSAFMTSS